MSVDGTGFIIAVALAIYGTGTAALGVWMIRHADARLATYDAARFKAQMRAFQSRTEQVGEFIPPGAEAEIVELAEITHELVPAHDRGCFGCRYLGRYVLKPAEITEDDRAGEAME